MQTLTDSMNETAEAELRRIIREKDAEIAKLRKQLNRIAPNSRIRNMPARAEAAK